MAIDLVVALEKAEECRRLGSRIVGELQRLPAITSEVEARLTRAGRQLSTDDKAAIEDVSVALALADQAVEAATALKAALTNR